MTGGTGLADEGSTGWAAAAAAGKPIAPPTAPKVVPSSSGGAKRARLGRGCRVLDVHEFFGATVSDVLAEERGDAAPGGADGPALEAARLVATGASVTLTYGTCGAAGGSAAARLTAETLALEIFARACSILLETAVDRRAPLLGALATGKRVAVILFAGGDRGKEGMDHQVRRRGWAAAPYDVLLDARHGNVLRSSVFHPLLAAARAGWVEAVWAATPCESFSVLRFKPPPPGAAWEAPPVRRRSSLPGLPPTPAGWEDFVGRHERFVEITALTVEAVRAWGGAVIIENPVDRGDEGRTRFYRREYADHAPHSSCIPASPR